LKFKIVTALRASHDPFQLSPLLALIAFTELTLSESCVEKRD
jgi:hypothetical protein